ncbi:phosphonate ABC transporter ATP-binding protein [Thermaerobacter subterraneus]|uniref:Phosphonate ABC transporter, ATP-binding protein n=1 Tax=Thermaerobacter subterraneus DSM 13965 TaxID=867903 RepID=K6Q252_9FIRM|nr:phosphonate ABC transporter ATP-binding protein [Thermaerobacter subterraneus]EKP95054.1 phosphonate ABC transporter, ATP-binding protein [Thermaerobacter subterraneus DSM 13965]
MIEFRHVSKVYPGGVRALRDVSLKINPGEFVVIVGLSGAGKSTLLRCINRLIEPTEGEILVDGVDVRKLKGAELRRLRSQIGMVFQTFNLVKRSSVIKNVLAGRLAHTPVWRGLLGWFPREDVRLALECLDRVGIADKAWVRADQLSGGQQQRVAIARALAQRPKIILADEPVASLDPPTSHVVMSDLRRINREDGITTIVNLHFIDLALAYADRIIGMRNGQVVFDGPAAGVTEKTFEEIYGRPVRAEDFRGGVEGAAPLAREAALAPGEGSSR